MQHFLENPWGHVMAIGTWLLTLAGVLPALVGLVGLVYYVIQIYESTTYQKWIERKRQVRKTRKLARLKAEQKVLLAEIDALEVVREARAFAAEKVAVAAHEAAKEVAKSSP